MGSVSSEEASDQQSERCGSYSPSADVSGSDSSADFTARRCYAASTSCPTAAADLIGSLEWKPHVDLSEMEMMKERFSKLLLGEDMSGGGKGVCTALAISNAITNLSATVFGELWRLEPLPPMKKTMWRREMEWLLCVSDSIVEFAPSLQQFPEGGAFEVMVSRPRSDLHMNLPALRKLDAMLVAMLDAFRDTEFWYVESVADEDGFGRPSLRQEDKWWLPCPRVPPRGLSEDARRRLQQCRDCGSQILKAALAINSGVLAEIHIPDAYLDTLPKRY